MSRTRSFRVLTLLHLLYQISFVFSRPQENVEGIDIGSSVIQSRSIQGTHLNGNFSNPDTAEIEKTPENIISSSTLNSTTAEETQVDEKWEWDGPIRRCNHADNTALNKCLKLVLSDLKPKLANGIPEINLPPMDPLHLKNIKFSHGTGPIKIIAAFSNVEATGLSNYNTSEFVVDIKQKLLKFDMFIPTMTIIGDYNLSGNLFFFPVGGTGSFWLKLGGISPRGVGKLGVVTNSLTGKKSVQVQEILLDLNIESLKVHLTNLFNGDKLLGSVINNFLNENGIEIFEELRPQIGVQVGEMVQTLTNQALGALSVDHFVDVKDQDVLPSTNATQLLST